MSRGGAFLPRSPICAHPEPSGGLSPPFPRNVLTESARIARGKITDLAKLSAADHDAAVFPGGFGAAKNLYVYRLGALLLFPWTVRWGRGGDGSSCWGVWPSDDAAAP